LRDRIRCSPHHIAFFAESGAISIVGYNDPRDAHFFSFSTGIEPFTGKRERR
jgi:hypothetical protein